MIELNVTEDAPIELNALSDEPVTLGVSEQIVATYADLSPELKQAFLQLAEHIAYIDADGQDYYDALYNALYPVEPPAELDYITAVYTQSGTVYDTDSLDSLKDDLVVTAFYDDGTSGEVSTYTLSGTLTVGTSTITVSYGGKMDTFTVTVTASAAYVSEGLFAHWDAIDNQATGTHDATATTWIDKINGHTWTAMVTGGTKTWSWDADALLFNPGSTGNVSTDGKNTFKCTRPGTGLRTLEIVFETEKIGCLGEFTADITGVTDDTTQIIGCVASDNTVITQGTQSSCFSVGSLSSIQSITATYGNTYLPVKAYKNGEEITTRVGSHSFKYKYFSEMILGAQNNSANLKYPFSGKIHSIRFYDRELSASEIADNYAVDVARFGLGA